MRQTRLFGQLLLLVFLVFWVKGNYCQAAPLDFYENYAKKATPCRMHTLVIDQPLPKTFQLVASFMEERYLWVQKNPARTVLTGRSSRTWSGSDGMGRKTGGKKVTHTVISFEAQGKSRTALHFCFYVNGRPEPDPEKFSRLSEEIDLRLRQP
jgi:hypothetical protein